MLPEIINELHIERILITIHLVLIKYEEYVPDLVTTNQNDLTVIRYIKNLINELVKLKKESICNDYLKSVELHSIKDKHIKRWIRNILNNINEANNPGNLTGRSNNSNKNTLIANSTASIQTSTPTTKVTFSKETILVNNK